MSWGNNCSTRLYYKKKRNVYESRCRDCTFDLNTLTATYNSKIFAMKIKGTLWISPYSQDDGFGYTVESICKERKIKHKVVEADTLYWDAKVNCDLRYRKTHGLNNLYNTAFENLANSKRKGSRKTTRNAHLERYNDTLKEIKRLKSLDIGLGCPISVRTKMKEYHLSQVEAHNRDVTERYRSQAKEYAKTGSKKNPIKEFKEALLNDSFVNV